MALFDDSLGREIIALVRKRHQEIGAALGLQEADSLGEANTQSKLQLDMKLLIGVANGEFYRTEANVRRVEIALSRVLELLLGSAMHTTAAMPEGFWQTDFGIVVSRARWWISGEDLITISNAAALAFGSNTQANRMRIARAMDSGLLEWVPDPSVSNPQQNRRVLRPQVERLRDLSKLPEMD
jgi:hypothetical protein